MKKFLFTVFMLFAVFIEISAQSYNQLFHSKEKNIIIPESYIYSKLFSEGFTIVQDTMTKKYGFMNIKGEIVIPCIYLAVNDFKEGLAAVQDSKNKKIGYINKNNEAVIPFVYDEASSFGHDRNGSIAFPGLAYVNIGMTEEGSMRLISDGKWGLINKKGEIVLPIKYGYISPVNENIASILDGECIYLPNNGGRKFNGKMGFINNKGQITIPPQYDFSYGAFFNNGTVIVQQDSIEFMINRKGEKIDIKNY